MVMIHRFPEGTDVVAQCTVALVSGSGDNGDEFCADEVLVLQLQHIPPHGIGTHLHRSVNGVAAGPALAGLPFFTAEQVGVDRQCTG